MGMPGPETVLEEMMCCVLGDFIEEGFLVKLADVLYCGGDTPKHSWTTDDAYSGPFIVATLAYLPKDCHLSQDHLHPRLDTVPRQGIS